MKVGLVLGAGGTVGIAYHAGVLHALSEVGGIEPNSADLVVGTSAGSLIAAYVRGGWSTRDAWDLMMGTHPKLQEMSLEEVAEFQSGILAPLSTNPVDVVRRSIGSGYLLARSAVRIPLPQPPGLLRRMFPGGLFDMVEGRRRLTEDLPPDWPDRPLWLVAVNVITGRRIVLGRRDEPRVSLHDAVAASCAIPGVYRPVPVGRATLVDGGVHSSTNLDLAASFGCDLIIGVAPLAYDPASPPSAQQQLIRRIPAQALANEASDARAGGSEVLLIRPTAPELRIHGYNLMRRTGWDFVARAAYESTARLLETPRFQRALAA